MSASAEIRLIDCLEYMKTLPDKYFNLAVVDPPYGINASNYKRGGTQYGASAAKCKTYDKKDWDEMPSPPEYFTELIRVSENQIIWGANHFISRIPYDSSCWIVWNKENGDSGYADCELAWSSFKTAVRMATIRWNGMLQSNMKNKEQRIHPTQKPVKLYEWILHHYAKPGDKIFDSHAGSASSVIAALNMGFDITACEIDLDYFEAAKTRIENHFLQTNMFAEKPEIKFIR